MELNKYLESTNLSMTAKAGDIDLLIQEAKELDVLGVCVSPYWVKRASREIGNSDLRLVTVIGYPLGYQMTEVKARETEVALADGAKEIDIVVNASAFLENPDWVKVEMARLSKVIHDEDGIMKVILETDLWQDEQLIELLKICADTGVDYAKTSTGYHRNPVTPEVIALFRKNLPADVGIKASGGIKNAEQARALVEAGADRLGTSSAAKILGQ